MSPVESYILAETRRVGGVRTAESRVHVMRASIRRERVMTSRWRRVVLVLSPRSRPFSFRPRAGDDRAFGALSRQRAPLLNDARVMTWDGQDLVWGRAQKVESLCETGTGDARVV